MRLYTLILCLASYSLVFAGTPPTPPGIQSSPLIQIYKGWNLVASPSNLPFNASAINNVVGDNLYYYDSSKASWVNGVGQNIPAGVGFWVQTHGDLLLQYEPTLRNSYDIQDLVVNTGWNLLGMSTDSVRVNIIASGHNAKAIYAYDAKNAKWKEYAPYSRSSISAGQGFWLQTK